jgi:hypothetical protein
MAKSIISSSLGEGRCWKLDALSCTGAATPETPAARGGLVLNPFVLAGISRYLPNRLVKIQLLTTNWV